MIVNKSDKPKADHDIATNNQTKVLAIVEVFFSDTERQAVGSFGCKILAAREGHLRERDLQKDCWALFERSQSAPGEKRVKMKRPESRRREQGTEVKLCPLRLNTTEGAFKKEAQV